MAAGWKRFVLSGLLVLYGAQALWIQPHNLSYFNLLAGGPGNGDRFLLDSNYDWGQNDRYLERHVAGTGLDYKIDPDPFSPTTGVTNGSFSNRRVESRVRPPEGGGWWMILRRSPRPEYTGLGLLPRRQADHNCAREMVVCPAK